MGCKQAFSKPVATFLVYLGFSKWYIRYTRVVFTKPVAHFAVYHLIYAFLQVVLFARYQHISPLFCCIHPIEMLNFCELFNAFKFKPSVDLNTSYCVRNLVKTQYIDLSLKMSYNSSMEK